MHVRLFALIDAEVELFAHTKFTTLVVSERR